MKIWKLNNNKWRHNDVITQNNGNVRYLTLTSIKFDPDSQKIWNLEKNLRFSNPNNMEWRHDDVIIVFFWICL